MATKGAHNSEALPGCSAECGICEVKVRFGLRSRDGDSTQGNQSTFNAHFIAPKCMGNEYQIRSLQWKGSNGKSKDAARDGAGVLRFLSGSSLERRNELGRSHVFWIALLLQFGHELRLLERGTPSKEFNQGIMQFLFGITGIAVLPLELVRISNQCAG